MIIREGGVAVAPTGYAVLGPQGQDCGCCGGTGCTGPSSPCATGTAQNSVNLAYTGDPCTITCGGSRSGQAWQTVPHVLSLAFIIRTSVPARVETAFGANWTGGAGCFFRSALTYNYTQAVAPQCNAIAYPFYVWVGMVRNGTDPFVWDVRGVFSAAVPQGFNQTDEAYPIFSYGPHTAPTSTVQCGQPWSVSFQSGPTLVCDGDSAYSGRATYTLSGGS